MADFYAAIDRTASLTSNIELVSIRGFAYVMQKPCKLGPNGEPQRLSKPSRHSSDFMQMVTQWLPAGFVRQIWHRVSKPFHKSTITPVSELYDTVN